jgi:hypothetical protein
MPRQRPRGVRSLNAKHREQRRFTIDRSAQESHRRFDQRQNLRAPVEAARDHDLVLDGLERVHRLMRHRRAAVRSRCEAKRRKRRRHWRYREHDEQRGDCGRQVASTKDVHAAQFCKIDTNVAARASSRTSNFRRKFAESDAARFRHRRGRPTFSSVQTDIAHTIVGVRDTAYFERAGPDRPAR